MSTATSITTADQLLRMPDDGYRYELIKGELRQMSPAGGEHGIVVGRLTSLLGAYVLGRNLGEVVGAETGFRVARNPDTVRAPDVAFVPRSTIEEIGISQAFIPRAPTLLAEVVSPNDSSEEVDEKMRCWLEAGVKLAWVVHPRNRTVTVYRSLNDVTLLNEDDLLTGDPVVPGFSCQISELFIG